jgi:hypothetical protein
MGNSLDSDLKVKWTVDYSGPIKTAGLMYLCRVPSINNSTAVHVFLQCYESGWKPTEKLRRIVAVEIFNRMLLDKSIDPAESVILFHMRFKKVHACQVVHSKSPSPLIGKNALLVLWRNVTSLPISQNAKFFRVEVDTQTERLNCARHLVCAVPVYVGDILKAASALHRPVMGALARYASKLEYGYLSDLQMTARYKACFNTFMERFFASPALLSEIETLVSENSGEKLVLNCHIDWETFEVSGQHTYYLEPLRQAFLWHDMTEEGLNKLVTTRGLIFVVQLAFERRRAGKTIIGLGDTVPLPNRPPLTNYVLGYLERPVEYICTHCYKGSETMSRCMRCKAARYCSEECRDLHWKTGHDKVCKGIASLLGFPVDVVKA